MDHHFTVYPRYYVTQLVGAESDVKSDGDSDVIDVYSMYMNRSAPRGATAYQERVYLCAHRLFGPSFSDWLDLQRKNPKLVGLNLEFINDTLRFLEGGERQLSQFTWLELLSETDDGITLPGRDRVGPLRSSRFVETAQVIQAWCRRPHGFDDLVCTLNVLFGNGRHSAKLKDRS